MSESSIRVICAVCKNKVKESDISVKYIQREEGKHDVIEYLCTDCDSWGDK